MKVFILIATLFLSDGATIQYRMEPFNAVDMNDCLKNAKERQGALKEMLEELIKQTHSNGTITTGMTQCIAKEK